MKKTSENGLETWKKALTNVTPSVEVRSRRVGGATFQIPTEIRPERRLSMAMKWLIDFSRKRNEKHLRSSVEPGWEWTSCLLAGPRRAELEWQRLGRDRPFR